MATRSKTWWGRDFMTALESFMDPRRLARGRSYSGDNRIVEFAIEGGSVKATVAGNINPYFHVYKTPYYDTQVELTQVARTQWTKTLKRLGGNANWVCHLVLGVMPPTIEDALEGSRVKLLPRGHEDIHTDCSCPDWENPCKHVAGVYFRVAEMLDRDPFLLFELRGLERKKLFDAVKKSTFGIALASDFEQGEPDLKDVLEDAPFQSVAGSSPDIDPSDQRAFWLGSTPPGSSEDELPPVTVLPMRRAGDYPEFWNSNKSFLEAMGDLYTRIGKTLPEPQKRRFSLVQPSERLGQDQ